MTRMMTVTYSKFKRILKKDFRQLPFDFQNFDILTCLYLIINKKYVDLYISKIVPLTKVASF